MKIEVRRDSRLRSSKVSKDGNTMEDDRIEVVSVYHELREETEDNIDKIDKRILIMTTLITHCFQHMTMMCRENTKVRLTFDKFYNRVEVFIFVSVD